MASKRSRRPVDDARLARLVEDYLAYYPGRSVEEIAAATHVPVDFAENFLAGRTREEAARLRGDTAALCVRCGDVPATVGSHCARCAIDVRQQVQTVAREEQQQIDAARERQENERRSFRSLRYGYRGKSGGA